MKPILFSISGFDIYGYGLMYALSLVLGLLLAEYRGRSHGYKKGFVFDCGFYAIIIGVIGAKLLYWITVWEDLAADFWGTIKETLSAGFVVYGGIIAAIVFAAIYIRVKKESILRFFDLGIPSVALGQAIGRIGCLLAGCCYGKVAPEGAWYAMTFPEGSYAPAGVGLYPTQLLSTIFNFINFAILLVAAKKFKTKGRTFALYLINYGVGRFLIEFIRDDYRGEIGFLSTSQFISVIAVAVGIILMIFAGKIYEKFAPKEETDKAPVNEPETAEESEASDSAAEDEAADESDDMPAPEELPAEEEIKSENACEEGDE